MVKEKNMIYVTSDLHGYSLDKFKALTEKAGIGKGDLCFVLGDVIDRGDDSIALLRWIMSRPEFRLILGNHEAMLLSCGFLFDEITDESVSAITSADLSAMDLWLSNGGKQTLDGLYQCNAGVRLRIFEYIKSAPLYECVFAGGKDFILVHSGLGGFDKNKKITDYTPDELLWTRPMPQESYYHDAVTVFGHTPTGYYGAQHAGRAIITPTWINVDTGAANGGAPMILRLDDMQEFYIGQ